MVEVDALQIVFLGLGTGFGSALGTELAKYIVSVIKTKKVNGGQNS